MDQIADYRSILKVAFTARKERNPSYSLRSFARDLSVSASMLSEVLSKKKSLSRKTAVKMKPGLNLSKNDEKLFMLSVDLDHPAAGSSRENIQNEIDQQACFGRTLSLSEERFAFIANPKYLVLLSLIGLKSFQNNLSWIAGKLGIFQHEVNQLLTGLKKLKVIEDSGRASLKINHEYLFSPDGNSVQAIRGFHRSSLNFAVEAMEKVPVAERDFYTSIFAIDQNDLGDFQREVREFHQQMYAKYAQKVTADRVYALQNQMIPYTPRIKE